MGKQLFRFSTRQLSAGIKKALLENAQAEERALADVGHFLRSEVQKRTPVDEGTLTGDVTTRRIDFNKSKAVAVYIPVNAGSSKYAIPMHEGKYLIGWKSRRKQSTVGVLVGAKYIIRAIDDNRKRIVAIIKARLAK